MRFSKCPMCSHRHDQDGLCSDAAEIADIKRQLESLQDAWRELRRAHGKTVGELNESRAHAEALAGALGEVEQYFGDGVWEWEDGEDATPMVDRVKATLTAYRQFKEPGE